MADLGSKGALNADIDAKVTTNGANENTGARVNDCLNNIADTLYGQGGVNKGPYQAGLNLRYRDTVSHLDQIWEWQGTETTSTDWGTDSSNFLAIAPKTTADARLDALEGVKEYIAQISAAGFDGSHDPPVDGESNGLGGSPAWTSPSLGVGVLTLTGAFAVGKTFGTVSFVAAEGSAGAYRFDVLSANAVQFTFLDLPAGGVVANPSHPVTIFIKHRP